MDNVTIPLGWICNVDVDGFAPFSSSDVYKEKFMERLKNNCISLFKE